MRHIWGNASSPILHENKLILLCGPGPETRLIALDANDGHPLWQNDLPEAKGKAVGDFLISLLLPAAQKVQQAADRTEQMQRNLHVAFALAVYRKDNGSYPMKLDALAPKYLAQVPQDLFSGKGLIYRPRENGYLLYSVGANGKDEEGRGPEDTPPGDDLSIRMPLPELR